jgi:predicted N-acyltransferase
LRPSDRATALTLSVVDPVPADWERLAGDQTLLTSARWLSLMGDRPPGRPVVLRLVDDATDVASFATVVEDPRAYEPFNVYDLLWGTPPVYPTEPARTASAEVPARDEWFPNVVVTFPGYEATLVGRGVDETAGARYVEAVADWAAGRGLHAVAFLYVRRDGALAAALEACGFHRLPLTVRAELHVEWSSFDEYMAALSRNGRSQVRQDRRAVAEAGVVTARRSVDEVAEELVALRCELVRRHGGYSDESAERARLERLRRLFGEDELAVFCSEADGEMLGFSLLLGHRRAWWAFWCGHRREHPRAAGVLFEALFYSPIEAAIAEEITLIDYGIAHEEAKARRGSTLVALDGWLHSTSGDLEAAIARATLP